MSHLKTITLRTLAIIFSFLFAAHFHRFFNNNIFATVVMDITW